MEFKNELRIGNYVKADHDIYGVVEIFNERVRGVNESGEDYMLHYLNIYPVQITPELLQNFGFEKDDDGAFYKGSFSLFLDRRYKENVYYHTEDIKGFNAMGWVCLKGVKIEYAHQLQNLYFFLTGKELESYYF